MIPVSPEQIVEIDQIELDPLEIDPRPCVLCGRTIDEHEMIDDGDGPIFYCSDVDADFQRAVDDIVRRLELADPRDRWKHTPGEVPPPPEVRNSRIDQKAKPYRTADSTVAAFWYLVGIGNPERLKAWLDNHPKDEPFLIKLLEGK